ncbi:MAG: MATE family efflux transporter [Clostridia bacterium]|nr:MATE family efflux transporter [Clostridia bacterium]
MHTPESQPAKLTYMTETPIPRLMSTLAVPTIISMLITSLYNMADTYFVGGLGYSAQAAVGIALPIMSVIQAIGFTFGQGSGNQVSRMLGDEQTDEASKMISLAFFSAFFSGIALAVLGCVFLRPLVTALGASPTSLAYTQDYVRYILIGAPFMISSLVLNNQLRFQGSAFYGMIGIASGAIINIALDPLFIFVFHMGTGGAALATIISQFVGFCLLLSGTFRGGNLRLSLGNFKPSAERYRKILAGGLPSFWRQALASIAIALLNLFAFRQGGDVAVAAMTIVSRVTSFANSTLMGFGQGFQPVCGFNYGAKLYGRVREAFWFFFRVAAVGALLVAVIGFLFAPQVVGLFQKDAEVVRIGALAMRLQCVTFPLMAWFFPTSMTHQTIGRSFRASILAMSRQGLFFIPAILLLPAGLGLLGVQLAQPVADALTFLISFPFGIRIAQEFKALSESEQK